MNDHASQPVPGMRELPSRIEPGRDLWPDIEARLTPRSPAGVPASRRWSLGAIAASVTVAFLAGMLLGRQGPDNAVPSSSGETLTLAEAAAPALAVALEATEREYRAAWKSFGASPGPQQPRCALCWSSFDRLP